jgi:hypothetical protein
MRLGLFIVAMLVAGPVYAQDEPQSSATSLDNIRARLAELASRPLLRIETTPDFRVQVLEQQRLDQVIASLDFKTGPPPPGGLYHYEQQRLMFNPVDNPLRQPYAAFSGGELITIAIENLFGSYLAGKAINAVLNHQRAAAEASAKTEVARAILEYCGAQPNSGAGIPICDRPSMAR